MQMFMFRHETKTTIKKKSLNSHYSRQSLINLLVLQHASEQSNVIMIEIYFQIRKEPINAFIQSQRAINL